MTEHDERMLKAVEKIADSLSRLADAKERQNQDMVDQIKNMPQLMGESMDKVRETLIGTAGKAASNAMEEVLSGDKKPPEN